MNELVVVLSQDKAGDDDAKCFVRVDGKQVGGMLTVRAIRGQGPVPFSVRGDWAVGTHTLDVEFLNDLYVPEKNLDRNLYLERAFINGDEIPMHPIKMERGGLCPPIGFWIDQPQFSIPAAFAAVHGRLDKIEAMLLPAMTIAPLTEEQRAQFKAAWAAISAPKRDDATAASAAAGDQSASSSQAAPATPAPGTAFTSAGSTAASTSP